MEPGTPSQTAMMAATARGLHRLEAAPPWVFDDAFALVLVGPAWPDVRDELVQFLTEPLLRVTSAMTVCRSRYTEERLARGAFEQYVLLGAGLDTFAWRRPDALAAGLRVFEVDHPDTQRWKLGRIEALGLPLSDGHVFAPVDFEVETITAGLDRVGFDWSKPTFVSWLGVMPYLTVEANEAALRALAKCAPRSEVVMTYGTAEPLMDDVGRQCYAGFAALAASKGERFQVLFTPEEAEALVRRCGLEVADHPCGDALHHYFAGRPDGLSPSVFEQALTAVVPS
jgi:methyltransferase (TIGR00027 family)